MQTRNPSQKTICQRIRGVMPNPLAVLIGCGGSLPNAQYAVSFSYEGSPISPTAVSLSWLKSLSSGALTGALFNGLSTITVSSTFGYRFLRIAATKFHEEFLLFRQRKNTARFLTETTMALLSAITGATIAGGPFAGAVQWGFRLLGFFTIGGLSFLGMHDLIMQMTDEDYAFKLKVLDHLKRLNPKYHEQINNLLFGKELNEDTLKEFLEKLFTLAIEIEKRNLEIFPIKNELELRKERIYRISDYALSGTLAGMCSIIYIQNGYTGTNILTGNSLENLPDAAKIFIGVPTGLPLTLFAFFTLKFFQSPIVKLFPEIKQDPFALAKIVFLFTISAGNAAWYHSLARMITENENIFSFLLDTYFGESIFPWAAYITCLNMGANGLAPLLIAPKCNFQQPQLDDVIKSLEYNLLSKDVVSGLKKHSFFTKETKDSLPIVIDSPDPGDEKKPDLNLRFQ